MVPQDIEVRRVRRVSPAFNARHSAIARRYSYRSVLVRDIFRPHAWHVYRPLDRAAMDRAAAAFARRPRFHQFLQGHVPQGRRQRLRRRPLRL